MAAGDQGRALTVRQRRFVDEYMVDGDATNAAKRAGYAPKHADKCGPNLTKKPHIAAEIARRQAPIARKAGLSAERWAAELECIAHFDPGELYDAAGHLIPIHALPERVRRAITGVKMTDYGPEYKIADKNSALATVGKHLGMFERDNSQKAQPPIQVTFRLVG